MLKFVHCAVVAAAALIAGAANASTTLINFDDGTAPGFSGSYSLFTVNTPGVAATVNGSPFLAAPVVGASSGTATYTSSNFITAATFDWGSPDSYNSLVFKDANGAAINPIGYSSAITGAGLAATSYTFNFSRSDAVKSIDFGSTQRAFEIDNLSVTAVPEPASWALMIAGFAMVGVASRRRTTVVAA